jgi:hypothetical protein
MDADKVVMDAMQGDGRAMAFKVLGVPAALTGHPALGLAQVQGYEGAPLFRHLLQAGTRGRRSILGNVEIRIYPARELSLIRHLRPGVNMPMASHQLGIPPAIRSEIAPAAARTFFLENGYGCVFIWYRSYAHAGAQSHKQ